MFRTTSTAILLALALFSPALAEECVPGRSVTDETQIVLEVSAGGDTYYVANDLCQIDCLFSVWFYPETNGLEGLQRGDEVRQDETCGHGHDGWVGL